jgi:hypothetical protein
MRLAYEADMKEVKRTSEARMKDLGNDLEISWNHL